MSEHLDESVWRTSVTEVLGGGFDTSLSEEEVKEHIDDANVEVTEKVGSAGLSERRLRKIERELARHSIKFSLERMVSSEDIGPLSFEYTGKFDEIGLKSTPHGQNVIRFDETDTFGLEDDSAIHSGGEYEVF